MSRVKYIAHSNHGTTLFLVTEHPRKELLRLLNSKHASKQYTDCMDGTVWHSGYVVRREWFTLYGVEGRKFWKRLDGGPGKE